MLARTNTLAKSPSSNEYDSAGRYETIATYADLAGNDLVSTAAYTYDNDGRLTDLVYAFPSGSTDVAPAYHYTYDAAGRMTAMYSRKDTTSGRVDADYTTWARAAYNYDATGQLATTTVDNVTTSAVVYTNWTDAPSSSTESYTYDATGNRVTANGSTYTTGDANQLLCDGTYTYTYDANGNRTMKFVWTDSNTDGVVDDGERSEITVYAWDSRNRLASVTTYDDDADRTAGVSSSVVSYAYDYRNQMISRVVDSDGTSGNATVEKDVFVYDGGEIVLKFTHSGSGEAVRSDLAERYLWDSRAADHLFADEAVEWDSNAGKSVTDEVLWALVDHQNSVRDLAGYDSQNDVTSVENHRVYDSYGNLYSETNSAVDCVFGYTGRLFDAATGLQNNLNRWYDASTGRWISQDPIGYKGGINLYAYCGNSPQTHLDPFGEKDVLIDNEPFGYTTFSTTTATCRKNDDGSWTLAPGSITIKQVGEAETAKFRFRSEDGTITTWECGLTERQIQASKAHELQHIKNDQTMLAKINKMYCGNYASKEACNKAELDWLKAWTLYRAREQAHLNRPPDPKNPKDTDYICVQSPTPSDPESVFEESKKAGLCRIISTEKPNAK